MCEHRWRVNGANKKRDKKEWQDSRAFWLNLDRCCWYGNRVASRGDAALHICVVYFPLAGIRTSAQRKPTSFAIKHKTSESEGTHAQDDRDENKYERNMPLISRLGNPEIISPSSPVSGTRAAWDPRDRMAPGPGPNILGHMVSWDTHGKLDQMTPSRHMAFPRGDRFSLGLAFCRRGKAPRGVMQA